jgi:PAS domain S-box-containing protein
LLRQYARDLEAIESIKSRATIDSAEARAAVFNAVFLGAGTFALVVACSVGVITNRALRRFISERREAEQVMRQSEERFRSLVVATSQIVWTTDADGEVEDIPSWRVFTGQSAADVRGAGWTAALHPDDAPKALAAWREAVARRSSYDTEYRIRRHDGSYRYFAVRGVPVLSGDGTIREWVGYCADITERKQAEDNVRGYAAELRRSNQELEHFAYVSSHDLQEPLRTVASFSELLARRYRGKLDTEADEFIQFIVGGATRMQTLINDLLAFSRVGTRGKPFTPVDAETVLALAVENLSALISETGALITHDPLPRMMADETQFVQLLQNLLGNAIKFRRKGVPPQIHVGATRAPAGWEFSVRDNGIGIDPQYFDRIFIIFQRLHGRDEYPGTGIGLAICKKIVERHGGRICVQSQRGEGSVFQFTISETTTLS